MIYNIQTNTVTTATSINPMHQDSEGRSLTRPLLSDDHLQALPPHLGPRMEIPIVSILSMSEIICESILSKTSSLKINVNKEILTSCLEIYFQTHSSPEIEDISIKTPIFSETNLKISFSDFTYKINVTDAYRKEGLFIENDLLHGEIARTDGTAIKGKFEHIPELGRRELVNGEIRYSMGSIQRGTFDFIPKLNRMELVDGELIWVDGTISKGKFEFIRRMEQVSGEIINVDGSVQYGEHQYNPESQICEWRQFPPAA
ncbi:hypothetical protein HOG98_08835 [bacterium]|jgi:hypothetical protein|nr:hypothetical protein [bacterium]